MNERRQHQGHPDVSIRNVLVFVVLISSVLAQTQQQQPQQDTRQSWIQVPFYPTNSVYELRHGAAPTSGNGADRSSLLLLDENNVRDPSKAKAISHEENEEEYVDEDYEDDLESEQDPRSSRVLQDYENEDHNREKQTLNHTDHLHPTNNKNIQKNNSTQQANHRVDPASTQYDSYYYYDDYENDTHSVEENVDYPDPSVVTNWKKLQLSETGEDKSEDSRKEDTEFINVEIKSIPFKNESKISKEATVSETELKSTEFSLTSSRSSKSSSELKLPSGLKLPNDSNFSEVSKSLETKKEDKNYEDSEQIEADSETPENGSSMEASEESFAEASLREDSSSKPILIGEAVVSVVTTKSVVNGTISVPVTSSPLTTEQISASPTSTSSAPSLVQIQTSSETPEDFSQVTTEDSSRILASVQTSRSISGARFLPFPVIDRVEQLDQNNEEATSKKSSSSESTESIIDKLDRVQSELSNGFLAGGFRTAGNTLQVDGPPEGGRSSQKRYTTTIKPPGKFVPRRSSHRKTSTTSTTTTTTTAPTTVTTTTLKSTTEKGSTKRFGLQTTLDDLEGLLPKNYPRSSLRRQFAKSTTASTPVDTEATTTKTTSTTTAKSAVIVEDISAFLPPGYKLKEEDTAEVTEKSLLIEILAKSKINITAFLSPGFKPSSESLKPSTSTTEKTPESSKTKAAIPPLLQDLFTKSEVDISAFLPKDFKQKKNSTESQNTQQTTERRPLQQKGRNSTDKLVEDLLAKSEVDLSAFLPKDFNLKKNGTDKLKEGGTKTEISKVTPSPVTQKSVGIKLVFPSRPGGRKLSTKITTPPPRGGGEGAFPAAPKIQKGWPTRATTEFTGWPTSSTTPISIEKLLEAARTATASSLNASVLPTISTVTATSTTTTTTTTPRPTTPGMCEDECEVAGTIRIIDKATWVPELLDRNTREWQDLANKVEREMNIIFSKSAVFRNWFKNLRIDAFSQGSILVDFFVELFNLHESVNTQQLKVIFHDSLRTYNNNQWNETKTKGPLKIGDFTIDPKFTDFVVIPKTMTPALTGNEDRLIPQWAIAVIVIGIGGLLFIIVFGVSVLANRQSVSKLKPSMMAMYDEETTKNVIHATHAPPVQRSSDYPKADIHTMWNDPSAAWNDKSFESNSNKVLMDGSMQEGKKYNLYDSWRSEWNGYYNNPSHTSSKYGGYDSATNLSRHHHPDYDTNF